MPANGIAVGVRGLSGAAVPLVNVLPQALPACDLYAAPDLLDLFLPSAGVVDWTWTLPNSPAIAGQVVFQQVVALDFATGPLTAATSTNRLTLTVGAF